MKPVIIASEYAGEWAPFHLIVEATPDEDISPEFYGEEMFTDEVLQQWRDDNWWYVNVRVAVRYFGTVIGYAILGGVEMGYMGEEIGYVDPLEPTVDDDGTKTWGYPVELIEEAKADADETLALAFGFARRIS